MKDLMKSQKKKNQSMVEANEAKMFKAKQHYRETKMREKEQIMRIEEDLQERMAKDNVTKDIVKKDMEVQHERRHQRH